MLRKGILFVMLMSTLAGCGNNQVNDIVSSKPAANQEAETSIELTKSNHATLIGLDKREGAFHSIEVKTPQQSKTFEWVNDTNPSFFPTIEEIDINGDQEDEFIIILTTATGTGVYQQELHIMKQRDLSEIEYEQAVDYVNTNIQQSVVRANGEVVIHAEGPNSVVDKIYKESDAETWFDQIVFGSTITYEVIDGVLIATLSGNVSPAESAVTATVEYDSNMKIKNMTLTEIDT